MRSLFLRAAVLAALYTIIASAQEDVTTLDPVIVTGEYLQADKVNAVKTRTSIIDVPQSLSIVTEDQIELQGFQDIGDIIDYTPGLNNSQGEGHRDAVVFRGIRSTDAFFIDGVRDDVQYYRPLYNLEQVEVLRGPNALLFGRGGTGGILNRVTKTGQLGEEFSEVTAGINSFGGFDVAYDGNYALSDTSAFRLNTYYNNLENHRDFFDGDNVAINPTVKFSLGPATTLDLSYEYLDQERFIDRGIPTGSNGKPVEAFDEIVFGDPDDNVTTHEANLIKATVQHNFQDNLKGIFTAFYGDYDKAYRNFYASGYNQAGSPDIVTLDGYVDTTQRENMILSGNLVGEVKTGSIGHTLIAGAEYINTSNDNDRYNAFWDTTSDDNEVFAINRPLNLRGGVGVNAAGQTTRNSYTADLNDQTEADIDVFSLFIQDQIELTPMFDAVLGARFDSFDMSSTDLKNDVSRSRKDEEVSPRAGLIFKPQENISIYGSYSKTFLPRSGEQFASLSSSSEALKPDEFENMEFGAKWDIQPGLSLTAAYFNNEQTRTGRDDETGEGFEVRGIEVDGFEVQLQGYVTDDFFLTVGYSNQDGETDNGAEIPRELPENMFSFWGNYRVSDRMGIGLGATYQDDSFITDRDIGDNEPHPTLPSYARVDASAYYDVTDAVRLLLNVENVLDETYFPHSHSSHQASVGAPLNARLAIKGSF